MEPIDPHSSVGWIQVHILKQPHIFRNYFIVLVKFWFGLGTTNTSLGLHNKNIAMIRKHDGLGQKYTQMVKIQEFLSLCIRRIKCCGRFGIKFKN